MDVQDWLNNYRKKTIKIESAEFWDKKDAEIEQMEKELAIFELAIDSLSSKWADLLIDHYFHKLSYAYISQAHRCSKSTAYNRVKSAEKELTELIDYSCNNFQESRLN